MVQVVSQSKYAFQKRTNFKSYSDACKMAANSVTGHKSAMKSGKFKGSDIYFVGNETIEMMKNNNGV
jgi:hypothetical protein